MNDFETLDDNITEELKPEDSPFYEQKMGVETTLLDAAEETKKGNKVTRFIILIVSVVFIMIGKSCGSIIASSSNENTSDVEEVSNVEYTRGEVLDNTYYNEWADVKIVIPEGYSLATEEMYQSAAGNTADCCLYIINAEGYNLIFNVEDVSVAPYVDEEMCADIYLKNVEESLQTDYADYAAEFVVLNEGEEVEIAGHTYYRVACQIKMQVGEVSVAPIQNTYIRKVDNRVILFAIASLTMEEAEEIVSFIDSYY